MCQQGYEEWIRQMMHASATGFEAGGPNVFPLGSSLHFGAQAQRADAVRSQMTGVGQQFGQYIPSSEPLPPSSRFTEPFVRYRRQFGHIDPRTAHGSSGSFPLCEYCQAVAEAKAQEPERNWPQIAKGAVYVMLSKVKYKLLADWNQIKVDCKKLVNF